MFAACQRLRRRALVVLAWLVLALFVAPAPVGFDPANFAPVPTAAAFVSEAWRSSGGRIDLVPVQQRAGVAPRRRLPSAPRPPLASFSRQGRSATRADATPWPAPDERWLYLKNNALLC